jgi:FKBP-type peptidyl-prolyl cis-trans isomerase FkpA
MLSRNIPILVLMLVVSLGGCQDEAGGGSGTGAAGPEDPVAGLETDEQKMLYVLGMVLGSQLAEVELTDPELDAVFLGIADSAQGRESQVDIDEYGPRMNEYMQGRVSARANQEGLEAAAFLEQEAQMEGATRTDSGIIITEIEAGDGASPTAEEVVMVHYHGTLRDGSVFDSSVERGEPTTFNLGGVIPCWTEGLQTMAVGGKSRLVCPPDLAYGSSPPPGIPPNAALVFEVELLDIVDGGTPE